MLNLRWVVLNLRWDSAEPQVVLNLRWVVLNLSRDSAEPQVGSAEPQVVWC